jgi:hypothetical protein
MRDRPTPEELLKGARTVLDRDIAPTLDGERRFAAILISRAMAVAARAMASGNAPLRAEADRLLTILGRTNPAPSGQALHEEVLALNRELVARIRGGYCDAGAERRQVFEHLCQVTRDKLAESNPRYFEQGKSPKTKETPT